MKLRLFLTILAILFPMNVVMAEPITNLTSNYKQQRYLDPLSEVQQDSMFNDSLIQSIDVNIIGRVILGKHWFNSEDELLDNKTSWRIGYHNAGVILMFRVEF